MASASSFPANTLLGKKRGATVNRALMHLLHGVGLTKEGSPNLPTKSSKIVGWGNVSTWMKLANSTFYCSKAVDSYSWPVNRRRRYPSKAQLLWSGKNFPLDFFDLDHVFSKIYLKSPSFRLRVHRS